MANNNSAVERELGRLSEMMERAKLDRAEILERITEVEEHLETLNGRTGRLETDNERSKAIWAQVMAMSGPVEELRVQVAAMREPVQIVTSAIRVAQYWSWRVVMIAVLAFAASNQALRVVVDYILKQIGVELGIGS